MTLVGVILGQVSFGTIADIVGRKCASITTAVFTIFGAILSSCVADTPGGFFGIAVQLTLCRFVLGLGIGGEYPLSATISKEVGPQALMLSRSQLLIMNMLAFNLGVALQAVLTIILLSTTIPLETVWRVMLACGAVPSAAAFFLRLQMEEPDVTDLDGVVHERRDRESWSHDLLKVVKSRWDILLGACLSWMFFNFVSYGEGTFSTIIAEAMLGGGDRSVRGTLHRDAVFVLVLSIWCIMGVFLGMFLESRMSRRDLQLLGFFGLAVTNWLDGGLFGVLYDSWGWFLVLIYWTSAIPTALLGVTTYLVSTENFPPIARGTCVGLAAAAGKVGAAIGTGVFPTAESRLGLSWVMNFCGFVMLFACYTTWKLTPEQALSEEGQERSKAV